MPCAEDILRNSNGAILKLSGCHGFFSRTRHARSVRKICAGLAQEFKQPADSASTREDEVAESSISFWFQMILENLPIEERFVRASGPGGQNVNKVSTAVELRLDVGRADLPEPVKTRLRLLAGRRMVAGDVLLIDSRVYRTQAQNRDAARARLEALLEQATIEPKARRKTKPTKAAQERRIGAKILRSKVKGQRAKIRDES